MRSKINNKRAPFRSYIERICYFGMFSGAVIIALFIILKNYTGTVQLETDPIHLETTQAQTVRHTLYLNPEMNPLRILITANAEDIEDYRTETFEYNVVLYESNNPNNIVLNKNDSVRLSPSERVAYHTRHEFVADVHVGKKSVYTLEFLVKLNETRTDPTVRLSIRSNPMDPPNWLVGLGMIQFVPSVLILIFSNWKT